MNATSAKGQLVAAVAPTGKPLTFTFDGVEFQGFEGQSVLAVLLHSGHVLRYSDLTECRVRDFALWLLVRIAGCGPQRENVCVRAQPPYIRACTC